MGEVTRMLDRVQQGDPEAAEELLPLIDDGLRRIRRFRERCFATISHTMKQLIFISILLHGAMGLVAHPGSGIAVDEKGRVFFTVGPMIVEQSGRIRKISPDGMVTTLAGSERKGGNDGPLLEATFDEPTGIAVAPNGDWFVLEPHRPRIRKISNGRVTTIHQGLP